MGLDFHGLGFLQHVHIGGDFGQTATIGRQEIHVNELVLRGIVEIGADYVHQAYCEKLLQHCFGAGRVDSIDNSTFENATHIHDMNVPLPEALRERYDTVIDAGTTEHIYNINQALKNCSELCKPGGQIIHILPANNFCGHGFWQFSPELFFSLYSPGNGYRDTEVFVAEFTNKRNWFKVLKPTDGRRVNIFSNSALYVMVRTIRTKGAFSHTQVQQSDYAYEWENAIHDPQPHMVPGGVRGWLIRSPLYDALFPLYHLWLRVRSTERLSSRNPGLRPVRITRMIA